MTFLGTGLARVLGEGLSSATDTALLPQVTIPVLSRASRSSARSSSRTSASLVYVGYLLVPLAWYWIGRTRPGLHLRAVGEYPAAADAQGIGVYRLRYAYVFIGGMLAGLAGATITLAISPGWFGDQTTNGRGWIAIGLVIFAQWSPDPGRLRGPALRRDPPLHPRHPGGRRDPRLRQPVPGRPLVDVLPRDAAVPLVILAVIIGSREAARKRVGAPAALGRPYVRGERGA